MSRLSRSIRNLVLAATAAASLAVVTMPQQAEAQWRHRYGYGYGGGAVAAGIIGGIAAGALIAGATRPAYGYYGRPAYVYDEPAYYERPRRVRAQRCRIVQERYRNWDGYIIQRPVEVCR
jgi:hypothetical protein